MLRSRLFRYVVTQRIGLLFNIALLCPLKPKNQNSYLGSALNRLRRLRSEPKEERPSIFRHLSANTDTFLNSKKRKKKKF